VWSYGSFHMLYFVVARWQCGQFLMSRVAVVLFYGARVHRQQSWRLWTFCFWCVCDVYIIPFLGFSLQFLLLLDVVSSFVVYGVVFIVTPVVWKLPCALFFVCCEICASGWSLAKVNWEIKTTNHNWVLVATIFLPKPCRLKMARKISVFLAVRAVLSRFADQAWKWMDRKTPNTLQHSWLWPYTCDLIRTYREAYNHIWSAPACCIAIVGAFA
jgi:hypothetical protein